MFVRDFINKYVSGDDRLDFLNLMMEWDGDASVLNAWYDKDVLFMKLKEVEEV
jgi:hypothetical protein